MTIDDDVEPHDSILSINCDQLQGNFLSSIWRGIIYDYNFPFEVAESQIIRASSKTWKRTDFSLKVLAISQTIMGRFFRSL
jgi:hypothetical protein